ncbi:MAG: beta-propeller fold lactonase family protein [Terriglobales bacterium]
MRKFIWLLVVVVVAAAAAILWTHHLAVPTNVAYVSEEGGAISMIDLDTLKVVRRVQTGELAPRGLTITFDGKYVVTSNKNTSDLGIFNTAHLRLVKRIRIGDNPEFLKIDPSGTWLFATFEPSSQGGPPPAASSPADGAAKGAAEGSAKGSVKRDAEAEEENGPPAQIASFHVGNWTPGPVATAGPETEGIEFSRDGKQMLVANESQDTLGVFNPATGQHIRDVDLKAYGIRPRGVKVSPDGTSYAVTMETSGTLLKLDSNLNVVKSVPTGAKPYGVAFDRAGKRIFVSAALARKLQVFSADSLDLLAEVPTGQRCWHFTFTPDDSKILLACGRSGNVVVVDANAYKPLQTIDGFKLPWGIVTYPRSYGSLGLP